MCLWVEFLAGTHIDVAIEEATRKAVILDLAYVKFKFNDVSVSVGQGVDMRYAKELWDKKMGENSKHVVITRTSTRSI